MIGKLVFRSLILGAAVGGPAVYFFGSDYFNGDADKSTPETTANESKQKTPGDGPTPEGPAAGAQALASNESPTHSLAEVLRFDVSTGWIMLRWPRVSTGGARPQLQGYRVSLVTGTARTDLAGALTYYFDSKQQVQRITFRGTTGDARQLVRLLAARYKFTRRLTNNPGLFVYEATDSGGRIAGSLHLSLARVIKASDPHNRFKVDLVIERPEKTS